MANKPFISKDRPLPNKQSSAIQTGDLLRVLEIAQQLAITTDLQALLRQIENAALDLFVCERATVFVFDNKKNELYSYVSTRNEKIRFPVEQGIAGACFRSNQIIKVADAYSDSRFNPRIDHETGFKTRNILSCPLTTHNQKPLGVLQILNKRHGQFNQRDQLLLHMLSAQCGVALERQFLLEQFADKQRLQRELTIAHNIQQNLLPKHPPQVSGFDIAGWSQPAEETGGDFFNYQYLVDGRLLLVVADVAGHGIGPALLAAQCHSLQKAIFALIADIQQGVTLINRLLSEDLPTDRFVTLFFALLSPNNNKVTFTSAGHSPAILFRSKDNHLLSLPVHGPPMGIVPDNIYQSWDQFYFNPGDMLLVFTDGFVEWENPQGEPFGVEHLGKIITRCQTLPAAEIIQRIYNELVSYGGNNPQADDLTAVIVKKI
jgi:phosphoserine phosphatase RsbU/P